MVDKVGTMLVWRAEQSPSADNLGAVEVVTLLYSRGISAGTNSCI